VDVASQVWILISSVRSHLRVARQLTRRALLTSSTLRRLAEQDRRAVRLAVRIRVKVRIRAVRATWRAISNDFIASVHESSDHVGAFLLINRILTYPLY